MKNISNFFEDLFDVDNGSDILIGREISPNIYVSGVSREVVLLSKTAEGKTDFYHGILESNEIKKLFELMKLTKKSVFCLDWEVEIDVEDISDFKGMTIKAPFVEMFMRSQKTVSNLNIISDTVLVCGLDRISEINFYRTNITTKWLNVYWRGVPKFDNCELQIDDFTFAGGTGISYSLSAYVHMDSDKPMNDTIGLNKLPDYIKKNIPIKILIGNNVTCVYVHKSNKRDLRKYKNPVFDYGEWRAYLSDEDFKNKLKKS